MLKFKLFRWTEHDDITLEEYIDILENRGWSSTGTTIIRTDTSTGKPERIIVHCVKNG